MRENVVFRNGAIGFLKFVASLFIVWRHMRFVIGDTNYPLNSSYIFVELFLMITGFFVYKKSQSKVTIAFDQKVINILRSIVCKYKKLLPIIIISVIIAYVLAIIENPENTMQLVAEIPFSILPLSSFVRSQNVPLWYISAYFLVLPFFQVVCDIISNRRYGKILLPFVLVSPVIYYCSLPEPYTSGLACLCRCFFALCLGVVVYYVAESVKNMKNNAWIFTIIEFLLFAVVLGLIYPCAENSISGTVATPLIIMIFIILLAIIFSRRSYAVKLDNKRFCNILEELSTTIFLVHFPIVKAMGVYLPMEIPIVLKIVLTYSVVLVCAIFSRKIVDDILSVYGK